MIIPAGLRMVSGRFYFTVLYLLSNAGYFMLNELIAISLILLISGHILLIRGCFGIKEQIPVQGGAIADRIERTSELLDEVAQLIADLADGMSNTSSGITQTQSGIGDLLTMFLNNRMSMSNADADTQKQEWEVLPPNENPQTL